MRLNLLAGCLLVAAVSAGPSPNSSAPNVVIDQASFVGYTDGVTDSFLGIKFADAP